MNQVQIEYDVADGAGQVNLTTKRALEAAIREVYGHTNVKMVRRPGAAFCFGVTAPTVWQITLNSPAVTHPQLVAAIRAALPRQPVTPWLGRIPDDKVLYLDIETHEAQRMWDMPVTEFFRLGQFAFGPVGDVHLTENLNEVYEAIEQAEAIIAHHGYPFDFLVLLRDRILDYNLFDSMVFANQAFPAPRMFTMRDGSRVYTEKNPNAVAKWLGLDNLAFQLGQPGKEGDLRALARKYGGFGLIPTSDPEYREYARGDIPLLQHVVTELVTIHTPTKYDWREQAKAAIDAQMTLNGVRIDVAGARQRIEELTVRKAEILADLAEKYDFPTNGKMPWRTKTGKQAILNILADYGLHPENFDDTVWPKLKTGPSLGGKVLLEVTQGTDAEDLGEVLAELQGQRWIAQTALDHLHSDGLCHPQINGWQRSGRRSVTEPGLTIWGERNPRDKRYIVAKPGHLLLECDLSNADQRIVAALSGDPEYAKRFVPGADGHEISGRLMFGDAVYDSDPARHRFIAKQLSHAYAYGAGKYKLSLASKQPLDLAEQFVNAMKRAYPGVTRWQNMVREQAERGFILNRWGRRITIDRGQEYTQAPAAHGQSGTTEVLYDGLIRLAQKYPDLVKYLVCVIHDAVLFDMPADLVETAKPKIKECMECEINGIHFPVSFGPAADNWEAARHT